MEKSGVFVVVLLVVVVGFSFVGLQTNKVVGQTTSSSSSSSGTAATSSSSSLNKNFTGIWKARLEKGSANVSSSGSTQEPTGSRIVTLMLCVREGKLEGTVQQGGVIEKGVITSSSAISANEVSVTVKDKKDKSVTLTLKLLGERQMTVTFADGRTTTARKLNPFIGCFASGEHGNEGMHGPGMSFMGGSEDHGMGFPGMSFMGGPESHGGGHGMSGLEGRFQFKTTHGHHGSHGGGHHPHGGHHHGM